jgi:hypothetical protein
LATAKSTLPSSLKSELVMEEGSVPAVKLMGAEKLPDPLPINTEIELPKLKFATAKSIYPSPLKSALVAIQGLEPAGKLVAAKKHTCASVFELNTAIIKKQKKNFILFF